MSKLFAIKTPDGLGWFGKFENDVPVGKQSQFWPVDETPAPAGSYLGEWSFDGAKVFRPIIPIPLPTAAELAAKTKQAADLTELAAFRASEPDVLVALVKAVKRLDAQVVLLTAEAAALKLASPPK